MDRQALRFIEMLNDDRTDEDGEPLIDISLKMKLFAMGENWLTKRRKLRPESEGVEGDGVTDMRNWINDPKTREALKAAMFEEGFVRVPEKKNGRPTRKEAVVRERYRAHKQAENGVPPEADDSGWQSMLNNGDSGK